MRVWGPKWRQSLSNKVPRMEVKDCMGMVTVVEEVYISSLVKSSGITWYTETNGLQTCGTTQT